MSGSVKLEKLWSCLPEFGISSVDWLKPLIHNPSLLPETAQTIPTALLESDNPHKLHRIYTTRHRRRLEIEAERQAWEASCELEDYCTSKREWRVLCQGIPTVEDDFLTFDFEDPEPEVDLLDLELSQMLGEEPIIDQILHPQFKRPAEDHSPASIPV